MDEVVAADSQSVTVAADLPNGEVGVDDLGSCGDSGSTAVDSLHGIGVDIIRQTAGAADTTDDGGLIRRDTNLGHGFLKAGKEAVVAAARTPTGLTFFIIVSCIVHGYTYYYKTLVTK
jgi:hypothetical protein